MTKIPSEPQPGVPAITHDELADNTVLLDVRELDEWDEGHAPDAVHIPLGDLEGRLAELPEARPIVVTCKSGGRSSRAVKFLLDQGYDAVNLTGGMTAWAQSNRPMTHKGSGAPGIR